MSTMTQSNITYLLDEVVTGVAYDRAFTDPSITSLLYFMRESVGRRERFASVGTLGKLQLKTESSDAAEDEVVQQFEKTLVPSAYALQVPFSREVVEDEEWGFVARLGENLGESFQQTIESDGAALFIDSETGATYKAEDNLSICNDAHVNVDGSNSQDNLGSNSFNLAGIKATRTAMKKFTNYRGTSKSKVKPDMLLVPVDLEEDAWEVVRSVGRPDTANRADNMYNGMFELVVWDELTNTTDWWMIDSRKMKDNLLWLWRTPFEMFGDGDLFSGTRKIGAYTRYSFGCLDWRWIYKNT